MTTVPARPPIPKGRGIRSDATKYSAWEWSRGYLALFLQLPLMAVCWILANVVKTLPKWLTAKLLRAHWNYTASQPMDFRIPPDNSVPAYMHRWWRIPRNWAFNIYYHIVLRSDDDRALHDHPWWNFSIVLAGGYFEHEIHEGGVHTRTWYGPGSMRFRWHGKKAHRLELDRRTLGNHLSRIMETHLGRDELNYVPGVPVEVELPVTTIFITGPVLRRWGFHDGPRGWIDAYKWDDHCERHGIKAMKMDGGSDAVVTDRNHHRSN